MVSRWVRWRSDLEVRRMVRGLMRELEVGSPLDVVDLCERLGAKRGRPIRLIPHPLPVPGPGGLWLATTHVDAILFQAEATAGHQEHIILHEIGHIISDHPGDESDDAILAELMPGLPPEAIKRALRRTGYDERHEREAELVATVIKEWATLLNHLEPNPSPGGTDTASRLRSALGDRQGWL